MNHDPTLPEMPFPTFQLFISAFHFSFSFQLFISFSSFSSSPNACHYHCFSILIALMVESASFEEGAAGTMPAQVCATLMYNVLSSINGFSTPATVTFTPVGAGGAGKYLTIRSTKLRSRMGINFSNTYLQSPFMTSLILRMADNSHRYPSAALLIGF